jgi:hypothetical protein
MPRFLANSFWTLNSALNKKHVLFGNTMANLQFICPFFLFHIWGGGGLKGPAGYGPAGESGRTPSNSKIICIQNVGAKLEMVSYLKK